jgi:hypothetical protein
MAYEKRNDLNNHQNISKEDRVRNDEIRRLIGVDGNMIQELQSRQLTWYGHVERMAANRLSNQAMQWKPPWRKKQGRPNLRWIGKIESEMSERNLQEGQ